jgi:hypothetical protein
VIPLNKEETYQNFGGINVKQTAYTTGKTEVLDLRNYTLEKLGSFTTRMGAEAHISLPVSQFINKPYNSYVYQKESGASYLIFDSGMTLYALGSSLRGVDGDLTANATTSTIVDFVTANDYLYYSPNGLRRFDGENSIKVSVSEISGAPLPNQVTFNTGLNGITVVIRPDSFYFRAAWLRNTPSLAEAKINQFFEVTPGKYGGPAENNVTLFVNGATITNTGLFQAWGFSAPPMEGVSSIAIAYSRLSAGITNFVYSLPLSFTLTTISGITTYLTNFPFFTTSQFTYDLRAPATGNVDRLAWFNNMLFAAKDNTVDVSTLDDIESFPPENQIQITGNPSDPIIAVVPFQDSLIFFKNDSVHALAGDSPETLSISDITFEYGITSPRAWCVFENRLFFMDKKAICEYSGSNITPVSDKIESFIDVANIENMTGLHVKKLNQAWFGDGSLTFVFDYIAEAWMIYDGHPMDKSAGLINVDYSGRIDPFYWKSGASFHQGIRFGSSLTQDLGANITTLIKTRYHQRDKFSSTELWRRFYLNVDTPTATLGFTLHFRPDYGSSVYLTRNLPMTDFQERIEFGIPAKSLSTEIVLQSSQRVRVNGYTIESRYLRPV